MQSARGMSGDSARDREVDRFSMYQPFERQHLFETLRAARARCPVSHSDADGGYWLVSGYEAIREVALKPNVFSNSEGVSLPKHQVLVMPPEDVDPPLHTAFRHLLNRYFSKESVAAYEPSIRSIADGLIDEWIDVGQVDLVGQFARPFTMAVLGHVVLREEGSDELARIETVVEEISRKNDTPSWERLRALAVDLLERSNRSPTSRDDVISALNNGSLGDRRLSVDERVGVIMILLLGGLDTTKGAISNIMHLLVQHEGLEGRLREPSWIRTDLDELLRYVSPVSGSARVALEDAEVCGQQISEGDRVLLHWLAANHDDSMFDAADGLNFDRSRNPHVAFGLGVHRCIGSHLARLQIKVAFEALLSRIENIELARGAEVRILSGVARRPASLPLVFRQRRLETRELEFS
jgi:cytochrome P450